MPLTKSERRKRAGRKQRLRLPWSEDHPRRQMQDRFVENLMTYRDPKEAARQAGYSESVAVNWRAMVARSKYLQEQIRKHAKLNALWDTIRFDMVGRKLLDIGERVLEDAEKDPMKNTDAVRLGSEIVGKLSATHKTKLIESERIRPDLQPPPSMLHVANVQSLMIELHQHRLGSGDNSVSLLPDKSGTPDDIDNDIIDLDPECQGE